MINFIKNMRHVFVFSFTRYILSCDKSLELDHLRLHMALHMAIISSLAANSFKIIITKETLEFRN